MKSMCEFISGRVCVVANIPCPQCCEEYFQYKCAKEIGDAFEEVMEEVYGIEPSGATGTTLSAETLAMFEEFDR